MGAIDDWLIEISDVNRGIVCIHCSGFELGYGNHDSRTSHQPDGAVSENQKFTSNFFFR